MTSSHDISPFEVLTATGGDGIRAYEDAATAIGRLDMSGRLSTPGLRELLVLRCIATAANGAYTGNTGMIALLRTDGEGDDELRAFGRALREGAARARGGAVPSTASLHALLRHEAPAGASPVDGLLRDANGRTPPLLKAALAALAFQESLPESADPNRLEALAVTLVLCVGGALTDAWLTLPPRTGPGERSLQGTFSALAREARAAERGLVVARELRDADDTRVRESLGRAAYSALDVLAFVSDELAITVPDTARALGITPPTAGAAVARLTELGITREVTGKARSRTFVYDGMLAALAPHPPASQS